MRNLNARSLLAWAAVAVFAMVCGSVLVRAADDAKDAKTFKPDEDGYIRNWLVLEPIKLDDSSSQHEEATQKPMFDKEYFKGQKDAMPKAGDKVSVEGKDAAWKAVESDDAVLDLEKFAKDAGKESEHAMYFGVVYLTADKETPDVKLSIGSDDSSVWWLNGKEVVRVYAGRPIEKDQDKSEAVTLKRGANVLKFAVINGEGPTAAVARLVDKDDKPVKDLKVSLTPPTRAAGK